MRAQKHGELRSYKLAFHVCTLLQKEKVLWGLWHFPFPSTRNTILYYNVKCFFLPCAPFLLLNPTTIFRTGLLSLSTFRLFTKRKKLYQERHAYFLCTFVSSVRHTLLQYITSIHVLMICSFPSCIQNIGRSSQKTGCFVGKSGREVENNAADAGKMKCVCAMSTRKNARFPCCNSGTKSGLCHQVFCGLPMQLMIPSGVFLHHLVSLLCVQLFF